MFNLISMCIVYAFFSRTEKPDSAGEDGALDVDDAAAAAVAIATNADDGLEDRRGEEASEPAESSIAESGVAVVLCMAVAVFDVVLLLARWLWCALDAGGLDRAM